MKNVLRILSRSAIYIFLIVTTIFSVKYLDVRFATFIYENKISAYLNNPLGVNIINYMPGVLIIFTFVLLYFSQLNVKVKLRYTLSYIYGLLSITIIRFILKTCIARCWVLNWKNNLALFPDHCHIFKFGIFLNNNLDTFPSGHILFTGFCVFSIYYLVHSKSILILLFIDTIGLLVLNYHYIGDCLISILIAFFIARIIYAPHTSKILLYS